MLRIIFLCVLVCGSTQKRFLDEHTVFSHLLNASLIARQIAHHFKDITLVLTMYFKLYVCTGRKKNSPLVGRNLRQNPAGWAAVCLDRLGFQSERGTER